MPIIHATYSDPDTADRSLARLRNAGVSFKASYRGNPTPTNRGGYLTHLSYPSTTPLSMASYQFQPAMLVATNLLPSISPQRTEVSINVPQASLDRAIALLRNSNAYSVTQ